MLCFVIFVIMKLTVKLASTDGIMLSAFVVQHTNEPTAFHFIYLENTCSVWLKTKSR